MCSDKGKIILGLCALLCVSSCSVKEDRNACPCFLTLDFSKVDDVLPEPGSGVLKWNVQTPDAGLVDEGCLEASDIPPEGKEVGVPRSEVRSVVWYVDGGVYSPLRGVVIPEGEQSPRIYFHRTDLDARCETLRDTVMLHKQYACVDITLYDASPDMEYELEGGSCGFEGDGTLREGLFRARVESDDWGECSIRVPRQKDGTLLLNVYEYENLVRVFNVGEAILSAGYDWTAPDLEDISLEVDYASGTVRYLLSMWSDTLQFSIVF